MTSTATKPALLPSTLVPDDPKTGWRSWLTLAVVSALLVASIVLMFARISPTVTGCAALVMMIILVLMRFPVAFALLAPSLIGMYALRGWTLVTNTLAQLPYAETASWSLSVIPMFILLGLLLWKSGVTGQMYKVAGNWLGWLPGGLAIGTNLAGTGLAAVSGSTTGTTYALARIGIPEMLKAGYDKRLAVGAVMVAGLPGQLIPPSILLVIYAGIAEMPIGTQLMAGVIPGIFVSVMFTLMLFIFAIKWAPAKRADAPAVTWADRFKSLISAWPLPVLIAIILGGIFSGLFTATEAAAVAALVAVFVAFVWGKGSSGWRSLLSATRETVASVGSIFFMLIGVGALARMLSITGISDGFAQWVMSLDINAVQFLLIMTVVYIVLGTFMEPMAIMLLTVPVLMPTLAALDISLLWFGVFVVFMGELAVLTPPVGILAFIIYSITKDPAVNLGHKITMKDIFNTVWWFFPMALIVVVALIFFPEIALWLPGLSD